MWRVWCLLFLAIGELHAQFESPYVVLPTTGGTFTVKNSASQISTSSSADTLVIPGDTTLDAISTSIITNRFTCGNYKMTVTIPDPSVPKAIMVAVTLTGSVSFGDKPVCTLIWGDGNSDAGVDIKDDPQVFEHTYIEFGVYTLQMTCEDDNNPSSSCPAQNESCVRTSNFLDNFYQAFETPMVFLTTDPVLLNSYMEITGSSCGKPDINWRVTRVDGSVLTPFVSFIQPETSVLKLDAGTLEPGEYVVSLQVAFPSAGSSFWSEDSFVIKIALPELVSHILGGEFMYVPHGEDIYIDATISWDPAESLASVGLTPLEATWSFTHYTTAPVLIDLQRYMQSFPSFALPAGSVAHEIQTGISYALHVNTKLFPASSYAVVLFTLSRGTRQSTAMQVIQFMKNVLPFSIDCVYNCHVGRQRLFYYDKIELDLNTANITDRTGYTYVWDVRYWLKTVTLFGTTYSWQPFAASTQSGLKTASIGIKSLLAQGKTFKIGVTVTAPGYSAFKAEFIRTVNYVPYGGTCSLDQTNVISARQWVTLACTSWKGNDDRTALNALLDKNPILSFSVRQRTTGALVKEESILTTRSLRSFVILKVGDPGNAYLTTLYIQVADLFNNYVVMTLTITSTPPFDVTKVTPDRTGEALVRSYTETDYPFDEQQLRDMGKSDMIISLVGAVCSNLHLIVLPVWQPPVPRKLNTDGAVLDLSSNGNADVGTLDKVIADANNETVDPATAALQDVVRKMSQLIYDVVNDEIVNGPRKGDKMLTSLLTNALTNLAGRPQYIDLESKRIQLFLAEVVGNDALDLPNTTVDLSAQIEQSSGELYYMFQAMVNSIVPDTLTELRTVGDLTSGREQISDMVSVIGQNFSLDSSLMSPVERAYLYMRMQLSLKLKTEEKKSAARDAANVALSLAQNIQDKLRICSTCSNEGSNTTKQLVKKQTASNIQNETIPTQTSAFQLGGLLDSLDNDSSSEETVSVSAVEFTENVYMYDNDGTSSFVTSNVLRIDAKTSKRRVTSGFVTYEQNVETPAAEQINPEVDGEDASEFMYHQFIYQTSTDNVCIIMMPVTNVNFTEYLVYIKYKGPPSIIDYDLKFYVKEEEDWQTCIIPEKMKGHSGITSLGVSLPGHKRTIAYNFTLITVGCLTWDEAATKWHPDKCLLEWKPTANKIVCYCRDITDMVFANSFFVAPNSIDFSTVFLKFSPLNQAAVMGTFGAILVIYIIAVIFLAGLDRRDSLRWGILPLRDNIISDETYYILKVFTGMRRSAGTTSRVAFILTGENGDSGPRELFDGVREEFSTGSIMSLFMATKKHLGELKYIYIWHDNSGEGDNASWYLNQVVIYDVQTRTPYTFVAERWLSVTTTVDAILTASPHGKAVPFETRFFGQTRDSLSESHMWVSILYRPQTSTFTRVQRASCVLVYLFLTMIANAMYFNPNPQYESPPLIKVGPLRFSPQQIFISIVCALVTTPPVMLLIFLFKRTKRNPKGDNCCRCCTCHCLSGPLCNTRKGKEKEEYETAIKRRMISPEVPEFNGGLYLPYWCIYFAWLLVVVGTVVPAFFILTYSMEWGKQKSEEWLTTFFMSLLESILFVDPIKVLCFAFILACLVRSNKVETNLDINILVSNYRQTMGDDGNYSLHSTIKVLQSIKDDYKSQILMPITRVPPLQGKDLAKAAADYRRHDVFTTIIKDTLCNVFFVLVIASICFANRDTRSYLHYMDISNNIAEPRDLTTFGETPRVWVRKGFDPKDQRVRTLRLSIHDLVCFVFFRKFLNSSNVVQKLHSRITSLIRSRPHDRVPFIKVPITYNISNNIAEPRDLTTFGETPRVWVRKGFDPKDQRVRTLRLSIHDLVCFVFFRKFLNSSNVVQKLHSRITSLIRSRPHDRVPFIKVPITYNISNNIAEARDLTTFGEITTPGDFFTWMKDTVIPHLFPETDINGVLLHWSSRDFRSGYEDYRLGPPRIRQLRTVNETCFVPRMGEVKCYGKYNILAEEEGEYCIGWKQPPCNQSEQVYNVSSPAWTFTSAFDIWGLPLPGIYLTYGGGGYIANLAVSRNNSLAILDELFNNLWMDRQTRAVMLEFTLYNAATNMFIYNMFLVEFPETGGALTTFSIYPIRVYTHQGAIGAFTIFCEVIFVLYLVFLLVKMCIRTYQQRCSYFKQFWNIYELIMLIIGISAIAAFAIRLGLTVLTIREFKKDKKLFVNFSHIVLWDQILVALLGTLLFMATLRILQVFATSKKVSAILRIFSTCGKDLFLFGVMFLYIFLAFCFLGVFLFGNQLASYKSMYNSMTTLFTAMIGYGIFSDIVETQPVLAKAFFMFYIILIVFFTLTIFMSILGASIDQVVQEDRADESEDIIEEIMKKIKYLLFNPSGKIPQNKIGTSSEENWKMLLKKLDKSEFGNKKHICSCPSPILRENVKTSRAPVNHGLVPQRVNVPPEYGVGTKKSPVKTSRKRRKIVSS